MSGFCQLRAAWRGRNRILKTLTAVLAVVWITGCKTAGDLPANYVQDVTKWRQDRAARLKAKDGWLSLVGLYWLHQGPNRVGSAEGADVVLPGKSNATVGVLTLEGKRVRFDAEQTRENQEAVFLNAKPIHSAVLKDDQVESGPDVLTLGAITFFTIERGGRYGIRVKDENSEARRTFTGLKWYPVNPEWRIAADWKGYDKPKHVVVDDITGGKQSSDLAGVATFERSGTRYSVEPAEEEGHLFLVFRDATTGKTTYSAARFLTAEMPKNGRVILDFNEAYNPPCAFTPYATCPLPLPQNRLPLAIEAGELQYGKQHSLR